MEAGFKKADSLIAKHGEKIKKMGRVMTVAGAAIVGALGLMIKEYATTGDWIDKMTKRTGMSAVALSELAFACQISGASLNDVEKAVKKMAKSITDADAGLETYLRSFRRIGIDMEELSGMKPEDQFIAIGLAIGGLASETEKAATAQEIFGRAGTTLLPLFAEGEVGIKALREEAHRLGIVFDTEAAAKAARLVDAQTRLKESMKGVSRSIAETLVPAISKLAENAAKTISKITDWIKENPKLAATIVKVVAVIGGLMTVLGPLMMILPGLIAAGPLVGGAFTMMLGPIGLVAAGLAAVVVVCLKVRDAQAKMREASERNKTQLDKLRDKLLEMKEAAGMTGEEFYELTKKYEGNDIALLHAIHSGKESEKLQEALAKVGKEHKEVIDKKREAQEKSVTVLKKVVEKTETWIEFLKSIGIKTVKETGKRVEALEGHMRELEKAYDEGEISLDSYIEGTKKAKEEVDLLSGTVAETGKAAFGFFFNPKLMEAIQSLKDLDERAEAVGVTMRTKLEKELRNTIKTFEDLADQGQFVTEDQRKMVDDIIALHIKLGKDIPPYWKQMHEDLKEETVLTVDFMDTEWGQFLGGMADAFGDMVGAIKIEGGKLKIDFNTLWGDIKLGFRSMISDMVSDFLKKFVTNIVTGATTAGAATATLAGGMATLGSSIAGLASGVASILPTVATAIASAASILAAAIPAIAAVGAVAIALYAGFMAVNKLLSGKSSKAMDATNRLLEKIWANTKETRDILFIDYRQILLRDQVQRWEAGLVKQDVQSNILQAIYDKIANFRDRNANLLGGIRHYTRKTYEAVASLPSAQHGATFDEPTLVMTHGSPGRPEHIMPHDSISSLLAAGPTRGGARATEAELQETRNYFEIKAVDAKSIRDLMRGDFGEEFLKWVETKLPKTRLQRALS